jgi:hypothetical protein
MTNCTFDDLLDEATPELSEVFRKAADSADASLRDPTIVTGLCALVLIPLVVSVLANKVTPLLAFLTPQKTLTRADVREIRRTLREHLVPSDVVVPWTAVREDVEAALPQWVPPDKRGGVADGIVSVLKKRLL